MLMMLNSLHWTYGKFFRVTIERHDVFESIWRSITKRTWLLQAGYDTSTQNVLQNKFCNNNIS